MKKRYSALVFLTFTCMPESFVTPKKKRSVSSNTLKQEIGERLGTLIKAENETIKLVNDIQRAHIDHTRELLEQKQGFFTKAEADTLHKYQETLIALEQEIESFTRRIKKNFTDLKNTVQ
jgi:hypothetical protein